MFHGLYFKTVLPAVETVFNVILLYEEDERGNLGTTVQRSNVYLSLQSKISLTFAFAFPFRIFFH